MTTRRANWSPWMLLVALILSLAAIGSGIYTVRMNGDWVLLAAGAVGLIATLAAGAIVWQVVTAGQQVGQAWEAFNTLFTDRMEQFSIMLSVITEQQLLSDRGKSVAFRDKDREALRRAIREEMARGEYDAALVLINDMENAFGYKQEADQLRQEIAGQRDVVIRKVVNDAAAAAERACNAEKWDEAMAIANRMATTYPEHEQAATMPQQVRDRKEAFKQTLLSRWRDAVGRKDIDASVSLLRQLDAYVSPEEVAGLKDGALEIFKARIEQLRQQFTSTVHEKRWAEAIRVGQDISSEFPTSKLAQEVRDMMPMLKSKAGEDRPVVPAGT